MSATARGYGSWRLFFFDGEITPITHLLRRKLIAKLTFLVDGIAVIVLYQSLSFSLVKKTIVTPRSWTPGWYREP